MIDIGSTLAISASILALWGVYLFNQRKLYEAARYVWFYSNSMFALYFAGRVAGLWDGVLGDAAMLVYFALMWWSNWRGLV